MGGSRPSRVRLGSTRLALAVATILVLVLLLLLVGAPTHDGPSKAAVRTRRIEPAKDAPRPVRGSSAGATSGVLGLARAAVTVSKGADAIKIPNSFLGVSTEYWSLPLLERHMAALQQVLSLLHWDPKLGKAPRWVFRLTPKWLAQTSALVRGLRAKVILDLNLVTGSPLEAVEWARVAQKGLPRGSLTVRPDPVCPNPRPRPANRQCTFARKSLVAFEGVGRAGAW
jgi:hypothetical protein